MRRSHRVKSLKTRTLASTSTPEGAYDDVAIVEGVVDVAGEFREVDSTQTSDACIQVRGASAGKDRQNPEGSFEFVTK